MNYCQDGLQVYFATETQKYTYANIYGHYELQPNFVNGRPYFEKGKHGLWFGIDQWWFGHNEDKGESKGFAVYYEDVFCPHQLSGPNWWLYKNGDWYNAENDFLISCLPWYDNYCTPNNTCGLNEGDCDYHNDCQNGLSCGSNNCPISLGFDPTSDCCYIATLGDANYCTIENTCGENEGDCDSHDDCQDGLFCGSNNCPTQLGFNPAADCCYNASTSTLGDLNYCTNDNTCGLNEGNCDSHNECQDGLFCGTKNCPTSLGFDPNTDCCTIGM